MRARNDNISTDFGRCSRERNSALDTLSAWTTNGMLVDMKPRAAAIGCPQGIDVSRSPKRHAVKADEKFFIIPNRSEGLFHCWHGSNIPLCCAMTNALARHDSAVDIDRPLIVIPRINVITINTGPEVFKKIPRQVESMVCFGFR